MGARRVNDIDFINSNISTSYTMSFKYGCMDIYGKLALDPAYTTYWVNGAGTGGEQYTKRFDGKVFMRYYYADGDSVSVHCLMDYFISSCAMGSASYGYTYDKDEHGDCYEHKIDYVRLYQTGAKNSQMITAWPQKQEKGEAKIFYPENSIGARY